jgi:hypothetical protein
MLHDQQQPQQQFVQQGLAGPGEWQQHWGGAAGSALNGQQQQQQQMQVSPASPLRDHTPPAGAAAAAGKGCSGGSHPSWPGMHDSNVLL